MIWTGTQIAYICHDWCVTLTITQLIKVLRSTRHLLCHCFPIFVVVEPRLHFVFYLNKETRCCRRGDIHTFNQTIFNEFPLESHAVSGEKTAQSNLQRAVVIELLASVASFTVIGGVVGFCKVLFLEKYVQGRSNQKYREGGSRSRAPIFTSNHPESKFSYISSLGIQIHQQG